MKTLSVLIIVITALLSIAAGLSLTLIVVFGLVQISAGILLGVVSRGN